ncbi:hypothetical protein [Halothiobacillus sp.]|uniref:hypothetical protein n=1 Tax=Halothiobacillus sp. TaxID=1891311 RepID=UPI0026131C54|nr:hypothetical protein [Halothiobacillus sp.]
MTDSIFIEGMELVRIKRLTSNGESNSQEDRQFRRAERDLKAQGVHRVYYDENDLMTCEQGPVYALHGRRYITQEQIDAHYPEARNRKHA